MSRHTMSKRLNALEQLTAARTRLRISLQPSAWHGWERGLMDHMRRELGDLPDWDDGGWS